jgi:hypothetical protein
MMNVMDFYDLEVKYTGVVVAYFEEFSQYVLERAVKKDDTVGLIGVPTGKTISHLLYRARCAIG